jgi:prepilin-type N-terminal cleavage/methylation domain-containing protein
MQSPSTLSRNKVKKGFTLIEILVVMAIFSVLFLLALFAGLDSYRSALSRSETGTIVSMLNKARSRSMANIDQNTWGVCDANATYILFEGSACTQGLAGNEEITASGAATVTGFATPVVFAELSGTTTPQTITVVQNGRTSVITINNEGAIIW